VILEPIAGDDFRVIAVSPVEDNRHRQRIPHHVNGGRTKIFHSVAMGKASALQRRFRRSASPHDNAVRPRLASGFLAGLGLPHPHIIVAENLAGLSMLLDSHDHAPGDVHNEHMAGLGAIIARDDDGAQLGAFDPGNLEALSFTHRLP
jgi:hypothetical protein